MALELQFGALVLSFGNLGFWQPPRTKTDQDFEELPCSDVHASTKCKYFFHVSYVVLCIERFFDLKAF